MLLLGHPRLFPRVGLSAAQRDALKLPFGIHLDPHYLPNPDGKALQTTSSSTTTSSHPGQCFHQG